MTTWACVSPNATILIMATMLLLIFVCYYAMDKKHLESPSPATDEHAGVEYTPLDTKGKALQNKNMIMNSLDAFKNPQIYTGPISSRLGMFKPRTI